MPARQIHGFEASLGLLHGLAGTDGAECIHIALFGATVDFVPELFSATLCKRVLNWQRTAQANHVGSAVTTLDALPARVGRPVFFKG